jgi:hypothetical protein
VSSLRNSALLLGPKMSLPCLLRFVIGLRRVTFDSRLRSQILYFCRDCRQEAYWNICYVMTVSIVEVSVYAPFIRLRRVSLASGGATKSRLVYLFLSVTATRNMDTPCISSYLQHFSVHWAITRYLACYIHLYWSASNATFKAAP